MGKTTGFLEFRRKAELRRPAVERVRDFRDFTLSWTIEQLREQGARCMNCAVPFCHHGCPLGNVIPTWNDAVYRAQWKSALSALQATNNFPEFTGRVCPAPCEASCVLSINDQAVAIEHLERAIADRGFEEGWIVAELPPRRTGKRVAVIGSGPAGLAAAAQLNRAGHSVTVFEKNDRIGGLLTLGIPEFKLPKEVVRRRVDVLGTEGIEFRPNTNVGVDVSIVNLRRDFDAVCLAGGSGVARTLDVEGSNLGGVHLALEFLTQQNQVDGGRVIPEGQRIDARGKNVIVLGGGDTGSDCVGTALRQGARAVVQFEILPQPPIHRRPDNPWPQWPIIFRTSHAHDEGGIRDYNILTKRFSGPRGVVRKLHAVRLEWETDPATGRPIMKERPGTEFELDADLVLLALGFLHPQHEGMISDLGVRLDNRGNVATDAMKMTSVPGVFAAGDMSRGQSLVVWAIAEGRQAAHGIDRYLMGETQLPSVRLNP